MIDEAADQAERDAADRADEKADLPRWARDKPPTCPACGGERRWRRFVPWDGGPCEDRFHRG